jgi:hypothetical protein
MDRVIYLCLKLAVDKQTSLLELLVTNEVTVGKLADGKPSFNGHFPAAPASSPCIYILAIPFSFQQISHNLNKKKIVFQSSKSSFSLQQIISFLKWVSLTITNLVQ